MILFIGVGLVVVAIIIDAIIYGKLPSETEKSVAKGLIISIIAGVAMGFFYRFVAASMAPDFVNPQPGFLTPYTAVVFFSIGLLVSNIIFVTAIMLKPLSGEPVGLTDYFTQGNAKLHLVGILGGVIWSLGMSFSIIASGVAGYAISYGLGQGATMVAAFWGVFIWKEFRNAPKGTNKLIAAMFVCFFIGLSLIIYARVA